MCGNGIVEPGEACDDGNLDNTDSCTELCRAPACGDGFVQAARGEDCDDANSKNGDGCNNDCLRSGKVLWTRTYAGAAAGDDDAFGAAIDKDGDLVVVGSSAVNGLGLEILIWKLSPTGDELRVRTVAGTGDHPDAAHDVAIDSRNQIAIAGTAYAETTPNADLGASAVMHHPLRVGDIDVVGAQRSQQRNVDLRAQIPLPAFRVLDPVIQRELQPVGAKSRQQRRGLRLAQHPLLRQRCIAQ